jgi:hypothetical protein
VTLLVIEEAEEAVVQIVPYVGGGSGGEGTKASARSGVVGRAVLRGTVAAMIRDGSFDEYVQVLVEEYATHAHEARAFPDDRFAFLAVPLRRRAADGAGFDEPTMPTEARVRTTISRRLPLEGAAETDGQSHDPLTAFAVPRRCARSGGQPDRCPRALWSRACTRSSRLFGVVGARRGSRLRSAREFMSKNA